MYIYCVGSAHASLCLLNVFWLAQNVITLLRYDLWERMIKWFGNIIYRE